MPQEERVSFQIYHNTSLISISSSLGNNIWVDSIIIKPESIKKILIGINALIGVLLWDLGFTVLNWMSGNGIRRRSLNPPNSPERTLPNSLTLLTNWKLKSTVAYSHQGSSIRTSLAYSLKGWVTRNVRLTLYVNAHLPVKILHLLNYLKKYIGERVTRRSSLVVAVFSDPDLTVSDSAIKLGSIFSTRTQRCTGHIAVLICHRSCECI